MTRMDSTDTSHGAPGRTRGPRAGGRTHRSAVTVAALTAGAVLALVLAGCSSSPTSGSATTTTVSTGSSSTASTGAAPSNGASALGSIASTLGNAKGATFTATYTTTNSTGTSQTLTIAQSPPKSMIKTSSGSIIDNGTTTLFCTGTTCESLGGSDNPLAAIEDLVDPGTYATELRAFESEAAAHVAGVSVSSSSKTIAGQSANCVTYTVSGKSSTVCVTSSGALASVNTSGNVITLTNYTPSASASLFQAPAGATVQTLPSGVSIP
jgi:hypothetical protein